MYQYDPETREFKPRRFRRPWEEESGETPDAPAPSAATDEAEPPAAAPQPAAAPAALASPPPETTEPVVPAEGAVDAGQRVRRKRRGPSPYLPQGEEPKSTNWPRRVIWVLIFCMLVVWVLMLLRNINAIKQPVAPILQKNTGNEFLPKL